MGNGVSTNSASIQAMLTKTKSAMNSWLSSSGSSSSLGSFDPNSIFDLLNQGQAALDGGDGQRAQAIVNMASKLFDMLLSLGNQTSKANKDVKTQDNQSSDLNKNVDDVESKTKAELSDIMSQISNNTLTINSAIKKLEELGGKDGQSGKVKKIQDRLKEYLDKIDEEKEKINDGVTSIDEKKAALDRIRNYAEHISALVIEITSLQQAILDQNGVVEEAAGNVENFFQKSSEAAEKGAQAQQGNLANASTQMVTTTATSVEGAADESVGSSLQTASFIPGIGAQASRIGADLISAGGVRIAGAASNIKTLSTTIGNIGGSISSFTQQFGQIGSMVDSFGDLVGQYGSQLDSLITATGSFAGVSDAYAQLETAIKDADAKLNGQNVTTMKWGEKDQTSTISTFGFTSNQTPTSSQSSSSQPANSSNSSDNKEQGNLIFNYDRKTFGI